MHVYIQRYHSKETYYVDIILLQIYWEYMCANNYFNIERFDEVIAKIKRCMFFDSQCKLLH